MENNFGWTIFWQKKNWLKMCLLINCLLFNKNNFMLNIWIVNLSKLKWSYTIGTKFSQKILGPFAKSCTLVINNFLPLHEFPPHLFRRNSLGVHNKINIFSGGYVYPFWNWIKNFFTKFFATPWISTYSWKFTWSGFFGKICLRIIFFSKTVFNKE